MLVKYDCKDLENILFGSFVPPKDAPVRSHRIGLTSTKFRYSPPRKTIRAPKTSQCSSETIILDAIKKCNGSATSVDIAKIVDMTRNHCGIILTKLYRKNALNRRKAVVKNIRIFVYSLKEEDSAS